MRISSGTLLRRVAARPGARSYPRRSPSLASLCNWGSVNQVPLSSPRCGQAIIGDMGIPQSNAASSCRPS